jgi:hypothetical protein
MVLLSARHQYLELSEAISLPISIESSLIINSLPFSETNFAYPVSP